MGVWSYTETFCRSSWKIFNVFKLFYPILLTFDFQLNPGKWERNKYVGVSLVGKTLAVLGFGKVGSEVARRAKGLGMHVIAHDPYAVADRARALGVELVTFDEALASADFISLHMPLTPTTSKMLNDEAFAKMKKGVRIVNVARGGVIDEEALFKALESGRVAQVLLLLFYAKPFEVVLVNLLFEKLFSSSLFLIFFAPFSFY